MKTYPITINQLNPIVKVLVTGSVLGNYWGGGQGSYPATRIEAETSEKAIDKAKEMLKSGSLDSGMGYESLIGAKLTLHIITRIEIEGKIFENIEYEEEFIGELTDEQIEFLDNLND